MDQPAKYVGKKLKVSWQETEVYIPAAKGYFKIKEITTIELLWFILKFGSLASLGIGKLVNFFQIESSSRYPDSKISKFERFPSLGISMYLRPTIKHIRIIKHVVFLGINSPNFACKAQ